MPTTNRAPAADSYMDLIAEFPLRRITTPAEHARAKKLALRLSTKDADRGTADYLDVLVDLIGNYEKQAEHVDGSSLSAADLVRHRIEERGLSISSLARLIGIPQSNLSGMLCGRRAWSKSAIRGLSTHLKIRTDRFLL